MTQPTWNWTFSHHAPPLKATSTRFNLGCRLQRRHPGRILSFPIFIIPASPSQQSRQHACVMSTLSEPRRPRLLPQNRKLRHLKGLSLRNLSFAPPNVQTADDAAIITSPNKLGKVRETGQLQASRSSDSLRLDSLRADKRRPKAQPRRSSLSLAHASPATRQKNLESLVESSVGDVFFSLHVADCEEPVYISEVRNRSAVCCIVPFGGCMLSTCGNADADTVVRTLISNSLTSRPRNLAFRDRASSPFASGANVHSKHHGSFY